MIHLLTLITFSFNSHLIFNMLLDHQPCLIFLNVVPKNCIVNLNLVPNFIFHVDHVKSCILLFLFQNLQDSFYEKKNAVCVCITCKNNQTEAFCVAVPGFLCTSPIESHKKMLCM